MQNRKSQITAFIIIGILVLFALAFFLYLRKISVEKIEEIRPPVIEEVPTELHPIRLYIDDCIRTVAVRGLRELGQQGGYIYPAKYGISTSREPTEANAVSFNPEDTNAEPIAYWQYFSSANTCREGCTCASKKPTLDTIQNELTSYISAELKPCLAGFATFKEQGFDIKEIGEPRAEIKITKQDIKVGVRYLIEASRGTVKGEMREFYVELPLNFQKIYEFASQITKAKQLYSFPERWTMQIINGVGGLTDPIPKMDWSDFQPGSAASWNKIDVKNHITANLLANYVPLFRVYNTREFIPYTYANPITTGIYAQRDLPIGSPTGLDYSDLDANFIYMPDWNIYFDIRGRGVEGNRITAEQGSAWTKFFSWLGMKRYSYAYDISYPIVVEINDKTENAQKLFGRDGYKFFFALEANIRDNKEIPCNGTGLEIAAPPSGSILCNENQWNSGELTIETVDAKGNPLAGVSINYACGNMIACAIGSTIIDDNISSPNYGKAVLVTRLPYPCVGGYLLPGKDGYWTYPINYSSHALSPEKTDKIKIALEKFRSINATIVKKRICKMTIPPAGLAGKPTVAWKPVSGFGALASNEIAQITLEKIKTVAGEEDFSVNIISEGGKDFTIPEIVPGRYKLTGTLLYNLPAPERNNIKFADEKVCVKKDLFGSCTDYDTMHIEPFNESFYEGGIELDNIEIPANYLDDYDVLTFKIVSVPDSCSFDVLSFSDTEQIGKYGEWAKALRPDLLPTPGRSKTTPCTVPSAENPLMTPLE